MEDDVIAATKLQIWQQLMSTKERHAHAVAYDGIGGQPCKPEPIDAFAEAELAAKIFEKLVTP